MLNDADHRHAIGHSQLLKHKAVEHWEHPGSLEMEDLGADRIATTRPSRCHQRRLYRSAHLGYPIRLRLADEVPCRIECCKP